MAGNNVSARSETVGYAPPRALGTAHVREPSNPTSSLVHSVSLTSPNKSPVSPEGINPSHLASTAPPGGGGRSSLHLFVLVEYSAGPRKEYSQSKPRARDIKGVSGDKRGDVGLILQIILQDAAMILMGISPRELARVTVWGD
ncbi:unnamed protein product [Rhizoctonia solani]|uniref:Uncharacterized protein n=1 Tax=Rhizoctonia solani TaxID=456999 RepID=A0A8H3AYQ0_9AGAM|nr:unnamed protein product [Rhizoctonia solani]